MNEKHVRKLANMADGVNIEPGTTLGVCAACQEGKQHRNPSHTPIKGASKVLDLIHSDSNGEISPTALDHITNYATFTDDAT